MVGCTGQCFVMKYMSLQKEMQRCAFAGMQHRDAAQGGWSPRLGWCSGRTQLRWVQNKKLRHLSDIPHISHINFCLLVLIINSNKALAVLCVKPKKTPRHRRSPKVPYFAALIYYNPTFINATTKPVGGKRWSPIKNVYHGSPADSCSSEEAKEAAIRAATISSPLTYRFCELCSRLWVPLAYGADLHIPHARRIQFSSLLLLSCVLSRLFRWLLDWWIFKRHLYEPYK